MLRERTRRSTVKALCWRVVAFFVTTLVVWTFTGRAEFSIAIGAIDSLIKIFVYILHERLWTRIPYGYRDTNEA